MQAFANLQVLVTLYESDKVHRTDMVHRKSVLSLCAHGGKHHGKRRACVPTSVVTRM